VTATRSVVTIHLYHKAYQDLRKRTWWLDAGENLGVVKDSRLDHLGVVERGLGSGEEEKQAFLLFIIWR
jgi:hypothetical protein